MDNDWIDITFPITNDIVTWPGDQQVNISKSSEIGINNGTANVTVISMSAHTGTHIDAPLHFIKNGKDIAALDLESLTGVVQIIQIEDERKITLEELTKHDLTRAGKIIFKTVNSSVDWSRSPFKKDYVHLSADAAQYLVTLKIKTVGIDYLSIGGEEDGEKVHHILLGAGITILEGLNMKGILPGLYEMVALPMKIQGADGAPARVIIRAI